MIPSWAKATEHISGVRAPAVGGGRCWIGLACWLVGFEWHWWRPWLVLVDGLIGMFATAVYVLGFAAVVAAVVNCRHWGCS